MQINYFLWSLRSLSLRTCIYMNIYLYLYGDNNISLTGLSGVPQKKILVIIFGSIWGPCGSDSKESGPKRRPRFNPWVKKRPEEGNRNLL